MPTCSPCHCRTPTRSLHITVLVATQLLVGSAKGREAPPHAERPDVYQPVPHAVEFDPVFFVTEVEFVGLERTKQDWLEEYLDLNLPKTVSLREAQALRRKILTTAVFSAAHIKLNPIPPRETTTNRSSTPAPSADSDTRRSYRLVITVEEKWTTMPVLRAAFGGGTPLLVAGGFDTHAFGRLWILGGEARRYGNEPPGFVMYSKQPRWGRGKHYINFELWRTFRRRSLFSANEQLIGEMGVSHTRMRGTYLHPIFGGSYPPTNWQFGWDLQLLRDDADHLRLRGESRLPMRLDTRRTADWAGKVFPTLIYDNVTLDNILLDGTRTIIKGGPILRSGGDVSGWMRFEGFHYSLLPDDWNLALHYAVGLSDSERPSDVFFLGGFDSVRGIPDGALVGRRALWANAEVRKLTMRWKYLHLQQVGFIDWALAGDDLEQRNVRRATVGAGFRFSVPQIYRFMLRIDFAKEIGGQGVSGISAGINQFFQPYRPLQEN